MSTVTSSRYILVISAATIMLVACGGLQPPLVGGGLSPQTRHLAASVCPQIVGRPSCLALRVIKQRNCPPFCGWTPSQLEEAYGLGAALGNGSGTNVALIEVGDLTNATSDLATYRSQYGLSPGNLTRYNEWGEQSHYPPSCQEYSWCLSSDTDIDMVSAACPKCNIFLVEADDGIRDFERAEVEAVKLGATIVSNSWNCPGSYDCGDRRFSKYFGAAGIVYLGASGIGYNGYGNIGAPAVLANVIAVGGTQLALTGKKYSETLWPDSGAGCASPSEVGGSGVPKPSWQKDPKCKYRTVVDVSAEAGCAPGVDVYSGVYGGFFEACGTGASTAFTAGVIAIAGNADKLDAGKTFWALNGKQHQEYFHQPSGTAGGNCHNYLCGEGRYDKQYSGPGGWGSPNGTNGY